MKGMKALACILALLLLVTACSHETPKDKDVHKETEEVTQETDVKNDDTEGKEAEKTTSTVDLLLWKTQFNLGQSSYENGDFSQAISAFQAAIALDSANADGYLALADVHLALGEETQAIQILSAGEKAVSDKRFQEMLSAIQEATQEPTPSPEPNPEETQEPESTAPSTGLRIPTPCFSVEVPLSWEPTYGYDLIDDRFQEEGIYHLSFDGGKGSGYAFDGVEYTAHIFSLSVYTAMSDFASIPNYEVIGTMTAPDGTCYYVVAIYPTDVQPNEEFSPRYGEMFQEIPLILDSITPNQGYTWTKSTSQPNPADDWATLYGEFLQDTTNLDSTLQTGISAICIADFDFDDIPEMLLFGEYDNGYEVEYRGVFYDIYEYCQVFQTNMHGMYPTYSKKDTLHMYHLSESSTAYCMECNTYDPTGTTNRFVMFYYDSETQMELRDYLMHCVTTANYETGEPIPTEHSYYTFEHYLPQEQYDVMMTALQLREVPHRVEIFSVGNDTLEEAFQKAVANAKVTLLDQ